MTSFRNPDKSIPPGEHALGEIFRRYVCVSSMLGRAESRVVYSFYSLALKSASSTFQRHFLRQMEDYLLGVCLQADERESSPNCSIEDFFRVRRRDNGAMPCFSMLLINHEVPDEVITNPKVTLLEGLVT